MTQAGGLGLATGLGLNPPLHTLTLSDCGLDDVAGTALAHALKHNSALRTLDLEGNELTGTTAAALGEALLSQTLRQIHYSDRYVAMHLWSFNGPHATQNMHSWVCLCCVL